MSHLPQVRGLKPSADQLGTCAIVVAPPAGAWVETFIRYYPDLRERSHLPQVRGLKPP